MMCKGFKGWLADVLRLPRGTHITVPGGATLIMPSGAVINTLNVVGGTVEYSPGSLPTSAGDLRRHPEKMGEGWTVCQAT